MTSLLHNMETFQKFKHSPGTPSIQKPHDWEDLFKKYQDSKNKKGVFEMVKKKIREEPIPPHLRKKWWPVVTGSVEKSNKVSNEDFEELIKTSKNSIDQGTIKQIEKDLPRTSSEEYFQSVEGQNALRDILLSYSMLNPSLGYCQGLNFIAAELLKVLQDKKEALFLLSVIIENYLPVDFYSSSTEALRIDLCVLNHLIMNQLPDLDKHLKRLQTSCDSVTSQWLLGLFTYAVPTSTLYWIWDCFFIYGAEMLFRVSLAILNLMKPTLLKTYEEIHFIETIQLLKSSCAQGKGISNEVVIQSSFDFGITGEELNSSRKQFEIALRTVCLEKTKVYIEKRKAENRKSQSTNPIPENKPSLSDLQGDNTDLFFKQLHDSLYAAVTRKLPESNLSKSEIATILGDFQQLNVFMFGSTKAGKSSLIRAITGEDVETSAWAPCTQEIKGWDFGALKFIDTKGVENWQGEPTIRTLRKSFTIFPPHVILFLHKCGSPVFENYYGKVLQFLRTEYEEVPVIFVLTNATGVDETQFEEIKQRTQNFLKAFIGVEWTYVNSVVTKNVLGLETPLYNIETLVGMISQKLTNPELISTLLFSIGRRNTTFFKHITSYIRESFLEVLWKFSPEEATRKAEHWLASKRKAKLFLNFCSRTPFALQQHPYLPYEWIPPTQMNRVKVKVPFQMEFKGKSNKNTGETFVTYANMSVPEVQIYYYEVTICAPDAPSVHQPQISQKVRNVSVGMEMGGSHILYHCEGDLQVGEQYFLSAADPYTHGDVVGVLLQQNYQDVEEQREPNKEEEKTEDSQLDEWKMIPQSSSSSSVSSESSNDNESSSSDSYINSIEEIQSVDVPNSNRSKNSTICSMITFIKNGVFVQPLRLETEIQPVFTPTVAVRQMTPDDHVVIQANFGQTMFFYQHMDLTTNETDFSEVGGGEGGIDGILEGFKSHKGSSQGTSQTGMGDTITLSKKDAKKIQKQLEETFKNNPNQQESATTVSFRQNDVEVSSGIGDSRKKIIKPSGGKMLTESLSSDVGNDEHHHSTFEQEHEIEVIVYNKNIQDECILGEVSVLPNESITQFRQKILEELDVEGTDFKLFKGKGHAQIPIPNKQNHKLAYSVFRDSNIAIIVPIS